VFVDLQQDDWVKWLSLAEFAANNAMSETTQCTLFYLVQGVDPRMTFAGEPTQERDPPQINADLVQSTM